MKKKRVRLTDEEANFLGLELKTKDAGRNTARYTITKEQHAKALEFRSDKGLSVTGKSTLRKFRNDEGEVILEWTKTNATDESRVKALRSAFEALKEDITPTLPISLVDREYNAKLCNQYTLTDYHLGMMAWGEESGSDWNLEIAETVLIRFFQTAIDQSPNAETCIFAQLGDFLHWDGLDAITPRSKHPLDADVRYTKLVRVAIRVIRTIISMLLEKYKQVKVVMAEGNHDAASSVWMREMLSVFYEDEPRIFIDTNPDPYYCITFGKVCLFYHHGHIRALKNIDAVFVSKFKKEFGNSDFVFGHTGHLHHVHKIESNLMVIEQHRTLSTKDSYSSRSGFASGRDTNVITYHSDFGEVGRNTINIRMVS